MKEIFISSTPGSSRSARSPSHQFYGHVESLKALANYVKQRICPVSDRQCHSWLDNLTTISSLDVDFDLAPQALTVSSMWQKPVTGKSWNDTIGREAYGNNVEVGVLSEEEATSKEDVKLGGWLTVLGEDTKPSKCEEMVRSGCFAADHYA